MSFTHSVPPDKLTKPCVAIVGFTDHRVQAFDLDTERFELWGLNELHRYHPDDLSRFSRWFEVHPREVIEPDKAHIETLAGMQVPVYMHRHFEDIPPSVPFPKDILETRLGSGYFTSSIAWEIAFAILLGAEEIHVYGVDLAQDTEYFEQRNCVEYWLGVANGMGIQTYVPPTSDLLKAIGQYGFGQEGSLLAQKLRERLGFLHKQDNERLTQIRSLDAEYEKQRNGLENDYQTKRSHLVAERNQLVGAIEDCNYWSRSWAIMNAAPSPNGPSPDRTKDPRTAIQPAAADSQPANRVAELVGEEA